MALSTYAGLIESVPRWAFRTGDPEFEAAMPEFIALTENILNNGDEGNGISPLRVKEMESDDTITLTDGSGWLPNDFLEARSYRWGSEQNDLPADSFEITGDSIHVDGDHITSVTLGYYAKIPPLTEASQSNWLITKDYRIYLYGCLVQSAAFSRDIEYLPQWAALFKSSLNGLVSSDTRSKYARASIRTRGATP
jgi:hypothetical protein